MSRVERFSCAHAVGPANCIDRRAVAHGEAVERIARLDVSNPPVGRRATRLDLLRWGRPKCNRRQIDDVPRLQVHRGQAIRLREAISRDLGRPGQRVNRIAGANFVGLPPRWRRTCFLSRCGGSVRRWRARCGGGPRRDWRQRGVEGRCGNLKAARRTLHHQGGVQLAQAHAAQHNPEDEQPSKQHAEQSQE